MFILRGSEVAFEEYKALNYEIPVGKMQQAMDEVIGMFENTENHKNIKKDIISLEEGKELIIDDTIYYIKKEIGSFMFQIMRLAKKGNENVTVVSKDFILQKISNEGAELLNLKNQFFPIYERFLSLNEENYVVYEFFVLGTLKNSFSLLKKENGEIDEQLMAFYFNEILKIIYFLCSKDFILKDFDEESVYIDEKSNKLKSNNFSLIRKKMCKKEDLYEEYPVLFRIIKNSKLNVFKFLECFFLFELDELIERIDSCLNESNLEKLFMKQRMLIYEQTEDFYS